MFTREEAEEVASFARERDLIVIADEAYEDLVYEGEHVSIASLPGMAETDDHLLHFLKNLRHDRLARGIRGGQGTVHDRLAQDRAVLHQRCCHAGSVRDARGADYSELQTTARLEEYRKRRDLLVAGLNDVGLDCELPAGAFYAFPNAEKIHKNSRTAAQILLEKAHIATVPGVVFGAQGEGHLRFGYAISIEEIEGCVKALRQFLG